jgi:hypothetical protein
MRTSQLRRQLGGAMRTAPCLAARLATLPIYVRERMGGFTGSDPILTVDEFSALVDAGELRYVLLGGAGGPGNRGSNMTIAMWVQANGTPVPATSLGGSQSQLYDLAGRPSCPVQ